MLKSIFAILLLVNVNCAEAGDYMLYVYNSSADECKYSRTARIIDKSCTKQKSWQSCTVEDVAIDIEKYLNDEPQLKIFSVAASLTNGHVSFCSNNAKLLFQQHLLSLRGKIKNKRHLNDFIEMYASGL
ncbi:MAG: hypothetical protein HRU25_17935 [Psychrobium sp.]|nr:hypothetical protein [Psychrobium sp.]